MSTKIDANNYKALTVARLMKYAIENGLDDFDVVGALEVICDYLTHNDKIFDLRHS